jgi:GT2 family glycosyltransferase
MSIKIAVIILNWNGLKDTENCLNNLYKQLDKSTRVFLLDNGSNNDESKIIEQEFNHNSIEIFRVENNLGFTGGCNYLIKRANKYNPEYYLFLNNDTEIPSNFLKELSSIMDSHLELGALSPVIHDAEKNNEVIFSGGKFKWLTARFFHSSARINNLVYAPFITGASMIVRRKATNNYNIFDDRFFAYFEDAALCKEIRSKGYKLGITPSVNIYHKVAASSGKESSFLTYLISRNRILYVRFYQPIVYQIYFAFFSTAKLIFSIAYFTIHKRPDRAKAFLAGYFDGWRLITGKPRYE